VTEPQVSEICNGRTRIKHRLPGSFQRRKETQENLFVGFPNNTVVQTLSHVLVLEPASIGIEQTISIDLALQRLEVIIRLVRARDILVAAGVVHKVRQVSIRGEPGHGVPLGDLGLEPGRHVLGDAVDGRVVEAKGPGALHLEEEAVRVRRREAQGVAAALLAVLPDDRGHWLEVDAALLRQRERALDRRGPVVVDLLVDAGVVGDVGNGEFLCRWRRISKLSLFNVFQDKV
jgi:hypothetical protein